MNHKFLDPHIPSIVENSSCERHQAPAGVACWTLSQSEGGSLYLNAVCNKRAAKAGYNGEISPKSMRAKAPVRNKDGERKPFKKK